MKRWLYLQFEPTARQGAGLSSLNRVVVLLIVFAVSVPVIFSIAAVGGVALPTGILASAFAEAF